MKELRKLAVELKAAYDLEMAAKRKQAEVRCRIIAMLGQEEGGEFLNMLRFQAEPPDLEPVFEDSLEHLVDDALVRFRVIGRS